MSVRTIAFPDAMWRIPKGTCRWSRAQLLDKDGNPYRRASWHDGCLSEYFVMTRAESARRAVWDREGGICQGCGADIAKLPGRWINEGETRWGDALADRRLRTEYYSCTMVRRELAEWHADHIVPLWSVEPSNPWRFLAWTLGNIQLLCAPCHKAKTKREAGDRARLRSAQQSLALVAA
ncbi:MAG TPA: hypothetical protein VEA35_00520 [Ramlibacter sp.]|nr:hypothetical protein [Ramlibacter sp.]